MTQVKHLEQAIEGFRSSSQDEMEFLFDSLMHSLAVASKNASTQSFERANPSLRHAVMLSGRLRRNLKDIPIPGDKLEYDNLNITFLVDENLENYREIHGWLTGLGFPKDHSQFRALQGAGSDRYPTTTDTGLNSELGRIKKPTQDDGGLYSDATLFVLSSKNNANLEIRFRDIYPISLSGLDYNQQETDIQYLTANVTFAYKIYEFATVSSSATTETTS